MTCRDCGRTLEPVEVALTRKLISRGAREFLCLGCLAAHFAVTEERLLEMARAFREQGCTLFP